MCKEVTSLSRVMVSAKKKSEVGGGKVGRDRRRETRPGRWSRDEGEEEEEKRRMGGKEYVTDDSEDLK